MKKWTAIAEEMYPQCKKRILSFASDWFGRQYVLDASRVEEGQYQILLFDPATGESFDVPRNFAAFHDEELIEFANEDLALETYELWLAAGGQPPKTDECVGYIKPLMLGGEDDVSNQEVTDMEVYWSVCTQIKQQIDELPEGTKIDGIELE